MNLKKFSKTLAITGTAAMMLGVTVFATSAVDVKAASGYKLVWSDEFSGTQLNRDNWTPLTGNGGNNPGWGNNEKEYYKDSENNIQVSNGTLKIIARREETVSDEGVFKYTSARMVSSGKQSFQYGKIEARMKFPAIDGIWPAFWMMGYNDKGWPYCGEIDILETWNSQNFAQSAWHWFDDRNPQKESWRMYTAGQVNTSTTARDENNKAIFGYRPWKNFDKTQFHNYGIIWTKDKMCFTLDDNIFWIQDISDKSMDEARAPYYFLLNMAVGGNLPGIEPAFDAPLPATMEVDYVRVYQKDGTGSKAILDGGWADKDKVAKYTVTVKNGSSVLSTSKVYDGETVVLPTLTKKGYVFAGYYNGSGKKRTSDTRIRANETISARWTKVTVPTSKVKLTAKKKAIVVKVTAKDAKGVQIKYSTRKNMKGAKTKNMTGKSASLVRLKSKKVYYVKARAYKLDSTKNKVWGKWSKVAKKTTK